jgi:rod shape-determining protein MreC
MKRLLDFLYACRSLIVFVLLELASIFLIVNHDLYAISAYDVIGHVQNFISEVKNYPLLKEENTRILHENAVLREKLLQVVAPIDALDTSEPDPINHLIPASVINNSIVGTKNYLTLSKGAMHGIAPGMGVVSTEGIVGRVKAVSDHFATVTSLLHTSMQTSAQISNSKVLGTVQWLGNDPCCAQMLYVPRHVPVKPGDKVVTSGYNATFFAGVLIGYIKQATLRKEAPFYDIELLLSTDFSTLQHVYVVQNVLKQEKEALEQHTKDFYD